MKKITFLFLAIFVTANIYAQTYTISFAATGAATTVDSVKVENLTHTATAKWHAGDVLQLVLPNGINDLGVTDQSLQVYPNPMQGQAEISFYAKQAGNARLSIYDIAGKEVLQTENKLMQGTQKYQLAGLKQDIYFINISGDGYFYTAKLISQNTTASQAKIKYIGNQKPETIVSTLKSTNAIITMPYTTGDNLRFTGYAGSFTIILNDVPMGSKTISFAFTTFSCGQPFVITHTAGAVAPVTKTVTYGTVLTSLSGNSKCWITQNLGATNQATAANDTTEAAAGWYWQFNRKQGYKHDGTTRTPSTNWDFTDDNSSATWEATKDPCIIELGAGWRIPTYTEWAYADANGAWANYNDTYASLLKLHAAGNLNFSDGSLGFRGSGSDYWSSAQNDAANANYLGLSSGASNVDYSSKSYGFSVRCIKD